MMLCKHTKLTSCGIQEHLKGTGVIVLRSTDNEDTHEIFHTEPNYNKHHGVGIIVRKDMKADCKEITEKNCVATIKLEK